MTQGWFVKPEFIEADKAEFERRQAKSFRELIHGVSELLREIQDEEEARAADENLRDGLLNRDQQIEEIVLLETPRRI